MPRFDKAIDERADRSQWQPIAAGCQVLILEGWCVGAKPEPPESLVNPINLLEALEDADGAWRAHVNERLGAEYQRLFARIDRLVLLEAPGFDVVARWRLEQEDGLRRSGTASGIGLMDASGVARFVQYYERLTRHILAEMPSRADLVIKLDAERKPVSLSTRSGGI